MQLSDFGLVVTSAGCAGNTNIDLVGTLGYVASEYMLDGKSLIKIDSILNFSHCSHIYSDIYCSRD